MLLQHSCMLNNCNSELIEDDHVHVRQSEKGLGQNECIVVCLSCVKRRRGVQ